MLSCVGCGDAADVSQPHPSSGARHDTATTTSRPPKPAAVHSNELGLIPVLMYHRLTTHPTSVYERTPSEFRAELERLAKERYVPITVAELTGGRIDIPAGTHPVALTFDDGDPSAFTLTAQGKPASTSAIGILLQVAAKHPGFRAVATMYVNADPYRDGSGTRTLPWLHEHGFEIGNHTYEHANLRELSAAAVRSQILKEDHAIRTAVPGYRPTTLALPFGATPHPAKSALSGPGYHYTGVLLVGANPAPSPFSADFDPARIPRIRSEGPKGPEADYGSSVWLDRLAAHPAQRYTSDGDPQVISYPAGAGKPADRYKARSRHYR
jgi:peptidoglycan/xylan/chitin deacetylase (PgdA/CDA1 family)